MGRLKRTIKIIGPIRLVSAMLIAISITVFVAWWIALGPSILPEFPFSRRPPHPNPKYAGQANAEAAYFHFPEEGRIQVIFVADHGRSVNVGSSWYTPEQWAETHASPVMPDAKFRSSDELPLWIGGLWRAYDKHPNFTHFWYSEFGYGWPMTTLVARQARDGHANVSWDGAWRIPVRWQHSLRLQSRTAPLSPAFPGFYVTALALAIPTYGAVSLPAWICGLRRRFSNLCLECGYNLSGLEESTCPECGNKIKPKRGTLPA